MQEDPPEEGMAIHSSILAWGILRTEGPGGRQSLGSPSRTPLSNWERIQCPEEGASRATKTPQQNESGDFRFEKSLDVYGKILTADVKTFQESFTETLLLNNGVFFFLV